MRSQQMKVGETEHSDDALGGDDIVYGSSYVDFIHGGDGNDVLIGEGGSDALLGGFGDDIYVQYIGYGNGQDTTNDGVTASYTPGYGGGIDWLYIPNATLDQLIPLRQANDLWISSVADASDGQITEGMVISNFFLGGIYTIEYLETQDYILSLSDYFGVV